MGHGAQRFDDTDKDEGAASARSPWDCRASWRPHPCNSLRPDPAFPCSFPRVFTSLTFLVLLEHFGIKDTAT